jgi:hypothetical protein
MLKKRVITFFLMGVFMVSAGYCQEKPGDHLINNVAGIVTSTDSVGNIISIRTDDQKQMAFIVPEKANITQETHNIGLMDIEKSDAVNIQYYLGPFSKNYVVNIVDDESVVNE